MDVKLGLSQQRKFIPQKYLYDTEGSEWFRKITQIPEYYPYRCEFELLEKNKSQILAQFTGRFNLVDLGAGDGTKTMILIDEAMKLGK